MMIRLTRFGGKEKLLLPIRRIELVENGKDFRTITVSDVTGGTRQINVNETLEAIQTAIWIAASRRG
jgi:hypothetical protein